MRIAAALLLAFLLLTASARFRPPEYDEAYSIFITAGDPRPAWPPGPFYPATVRSFYQGTPGLAEIAQDLRAGDVHPPLYFWALEYWRRLVGPGWFAARMLSVLFATAALIALAWTAGLAEIPIAPALLIATLSYGFAYTGMVARGFALAQALNVLGMGLILKGSKTRKPGFAGAGGLAFGAAGFSNYLAIFTGFATLLWLGATRAGRKTILPAALGLILFLPAIGYFFIAQRNSRIGQFAAFSPPHALSLLAKDGAAALLGGLPLYAGRAGGAVAAALAVLIAILFGCIIKNWKPKLAPLGAAALATPAGLLALGLLFNNTPIEIRYLAFSLPYLALLLAQTLPRRLRYLLLGIEACGIAGLILAPSTMQPQGLAAGQLRNVVPGALVLLPFGNDGVGIPGPFIAAMPDDFRVELIRPGGLPSLAGERNIVLVATPLDAASKQAVATASAQLSADPGLAPVGPADLLRAFVRAGASPLNPH